MQYKSEKRSGLSFTSMFFLSCAVVLFYNVQSVQAWEFHPFNVTVAVGKCVLIDLNKYVTGIAPKDKPTWGTADLRYLEETKTLLVDPYLSEQGILKICAGSDDTRIIIHNIGKDENPPYVDVKINNNPIIQSPPRDYPIELTRDKSDTLNLTADGKDDDISWSVMYSDPSNLLLKKYLKEDEFNSLSKEYVDRFTSTELSTESFEVKIVDNQAIFTPKKPVKHCEELKIYFIARDREYMPYKEDVPDYYEFTQKIGEIGIDYVEVEVTIENDNPVIAGFPEEFRPKIFPIYL